MEKELGIYIHIPFCKAKCNYCDFASFVVDSDVKKQYVQVLVNEIRQAKKLYQINNSNVKSVFFGGGTPSLLDSDYLSEIIEAIKQCLDVQQKAEITIECNPDSVTQNKLEQHLELGFNRFSFGLQSLNPETLEYLGRVHSLEQVHTVLASVNSLGIKNFSIDYLLGVKGQALSDIDTLIDAVQKYNIPHISAYALKIEEGTPFYKQGVVVDDDVSAELYSCLVDRLKQIGLARYEVSNFARGGFESVHNNIYWNYNSYLGFGLNATGFINGSRYTNADTLNDYFQQVSQNKHFTIEKLDAKTQMFEYIMLNLRKAEGFKIADYNAIFSANFLSDYKNMLDKLSDLLDISAGKVRAKADKFYMLNSILLHFLD